MGRVCVVFFNFHQMAAPKREFCSKRGLMLSSPLSRWNEVALNSLSLSHRQSCCFSKFGPAFDGGSYTLDNSFVVGYQKAIPNSIIIVAVNVAEFA